MCVEGVKRQFSTGKPLQDSRILFLYEDKRAMYLADALKDKMQLESFLQVKIDWKQAFFWTNLIMAALGISFASIRKGMLPNVSRRILYYSLVRRPAFIKEISSKIEKSVNSMSKKPDLILQWASIFASYTDKPEIPFALVIDNYTEPPNSSTQKDKLRGWSTLYDESFYQFQKKLYSDATHIFSLSQWCKEGLVRVYDIAPEKVTAIGWGPAKKIYKNKPTEKGKKTILAIGTDYVAKGIDILLKSSEYLDDFSITIVGKDPAFIGFKTSKNVQIKEYVSNETLVNLYLKSELFFIFSEFDPSPHVLWEAQACGCIIIGYDAYGISEAVVDGETGLLLKNRDPIHVKEEIRKLYQDKNLLKKMRQAAIENFNKNGTWNVACEKIVKSLTTTCDKTAVIGSR